MCPPAHSRLRNFSRPRTPIAITQAQGRSPNLWMLKRDGTNRRPRRNDSWNTVRPKRILHDSGPFTNGVHQMWYMYMYEYCTCSHGSIHMNMYPYLEVHQVSAQITPIHVVKAVQPTRDEGDPVLCHLWQRLLPNVAWQEWRDDPNKWHQQERGGNRLATRRYWRKPKGNCEIVF